MKILITFLIGIFITTFSAFFSVEDNTKETSTKVIESTTEKVEEAILETTTVIEAVSNRTDTGDESLNNICDNILDQIILEDMSEKDMAKAVYDYIETYIRYSGVTKEGDWINGAITALTTNKGNCYGFCCGSRALLTRLGFENMEVVSIEKDHYWNLVKVNGSWYHFDTTKGWGGQRFLLTDKEMEEFSYYNSNIDCVLTYSWNRDNYPETP